MNRPPKDRPSTDIMPLQATDLPYSPLVFISHSSAVMLRAWDHVTWQALEMLQVPETPGHPYLDVTWNSWKWASLPRSLWALVSLPVPAAASSGHGEYRQMTGPTGQIPQLICFLSRDWKETCLFQLTFLHLPLPRKATLHAACWEMPGHQIGFTTCTSTAWGQHQHLRFVWL